MSSGASGAGRSASQTKCLLPGIPLSLSRISYLPGCLYMAWASDGMMVSRFPEWMPQKQEVKDVVLRFEWFMGRKFRQPASPTQPPAMDEEAKNLKPSLIYHWEEVNNHENNMVLLSKYYILIWRKASLSESKVKMSQIRPSTDSRYMDIFPRLGDQNKCSQQSNVPKQNCDSKKEWPWLCYLKFFFPWPLLIPWSQFSGIQLLVTYPISLDYFSQ